MRPLKQPKEPGSLEARFDIWEDKRSRRYMATLCCVRNRVLDPSLQPWSLEHDETLISQNPQVIDPDHKLRQCQPAYWQAIFSRTLPHKPGSDNNLNITIHDRVDESWRLEYRRTGSCSLVPVSSVRKSGLLSVTIRLSRHRRKHTEPFKVVTIAEVVISDARACSVPYGRGIRTTTIGSRIILFSRVQTKQVSTQPVNAHWARRFHAKRRLRLPLFNSAAADQFHATSDQNRDRLGTCCECGH